MKNNILKIITTSLLLASTFNTFADDCEFSSAAALNDTTDSTLTHGLDFQSGTAGYALGCVVANALGVSICGEYFRNSTNPNSDEFCTPNNETREDSLTEEEAADYFIMAVATHGYSPFTIDYSAPYAPVWMLISQEEWENLRINSNINSGISFSIQ